MSSSETGNDVGVEHPQQASLLHEEGGGAVHAGAPKLEAVEAIQVERSAALDGDLAVVVDLVEGQAALAVDDPLDTGPVARWRVRFGLHVDTVAVVVLVPPLEYQILSSVPASMSTPMPSLFLTVFVSKHHTIAAVDVHAIGAIVAYDVVLLHLCGDIEAVQY